MWYNSEVFFTFQRVLAYIIVALMVLSVIYKTYKKNLYKFRTKKLAYNNNYLKENKDKIFKILNNTKKDALNYRAATIIFGVGYVLILYVLIYVIKLNYEAITFNGYSMMFFFMVFIIVTAIFSMLEKSIIFKYTSDYKNKTIKKIINLYNPNLDYHPNGGVDAYEYSLCKFREQFNKFHSEDLIDLNRELSVCDIKVQMESYDEDGRKYIDTVYLGVLAKAKIKNINASILIDFNRKLEWLKPNGLTKIDLENKEFNDLFIVTTDNEITALRVLTPDILEKLLELYKYSKLDYDMRIINNNIYLRFPTGDSLVNSIWSHKKEKDSIVASLALLDEIIRLMGELKKIINDVDI